MPEFPITPLLPEILRSLDAQPRLVLEAPPGAGKTTQVPLALLAASWRGDCGCNAGGQPGWNQAWRRPNR